MRYIKFVCSNGYCGCNEEFYERYGDNITDHKIDKMGEEILVDCYSFYYDDRFIDVEDYGDYEDAYEMAMEDYQMNCEVYWEEITKEEYEENAADN